jgi:predicted DNA-binding WGR domain protein
VNPGQTVLNSIKDDQFWQIVQNDRLLEIRFGKIGTRGQVLIQSFISVDEASIKKDELITEKLKQGYEVIN